MSELKQLKWLEASSYVYMYIWDITLAFTVSNFPLFYFPFICPKQWKVYGALHTKTWKTLNIFNSVTITFRLFFWDVMPCSLIDKHKLFSGIYIYIYIHINHFSVYSYYIQNYFWFTYEVTWNFKIQQSDKPPMAGLYFLRQWNVPIYIY
jgi:hypothetical protein